MELLNNIWNIISTPNETLINILAFPLLLIENYLGIILISNILNISTSKKQKILYVLIIAVESIVTMMILPMPYNTFVNFAFVTIAIYKIIHLGWLKSIFASIIPPILFSLIGMLISNPYVTLLNISANDLSQIPIYRISYALLIYLFVGIIIGIVKVYKISINFLEDIDKKNVRIICANIILGFFTIIMQTIILFYYIDTLPIIITFFSFITLLIYFSISIYSLTRIIKLIVTTKKLQSAEEYNNTLCILHDNVRAFKHDFDNIMTTIGGYIKTKDMKGLEKYYVQLIDDCEKVNNLYILNPEIVNNDGIYNLITKKYYEADSKDIKVQITFLLDLNTIKMKIYEFARILGILLDNAIEASSECEDKRINIIFRDDTKNSRHLILIENTFKNKDVDTDKIFEKGITQKPNHTGLGLWEVRKIIKKYKNVNLFTSKNKELFIQQLEIYY